MVEGCGGLQESWIDVELVLWAAVMVGLPLGTVGIIHRVIIGQRMDVGYTVYSETSLSGHC